MTPEVVSPTSIRVALKQLTPSATSFKTWIAMYASEKQTHQYVFLFVLFFYSSLEFVIMS
jgi:hypothetical protein